MQQPSPTRLPGTPHEKIEGRRLPYSAQIGRMRKYAEGSSQQKSETRLSLISQIWPRQEIGGSRERCNPLVGVGISQCEPVVGSQIMHRSSPELSNLCYLKAAVPTALDRIRQHQIRDRVGYSWYYLKTDDHG